MGVLAGLVEGGLRYANKHSTWAVMWRISVVLLALLLSLGAARAEPVTVLALGDSLTAGLGLEPAESFPVRLGLALKARGHDVVVVNAGVSGDTAAQGAARIEWVLTGDVDAVIIELGANDALRGLDPAQTEAALSTIITTLATRKLPVLLAGMRAPPNLGADYGTAFADMFARLAKANDVVFYPFFLDGVAADIALNQSDGMHPTAKGVDVIVARMLPAVEALIAKVTTP